MAKKAAKKKTAKRGSKTAKRSTKKAPTRKRATTTKKTAKGKPPKAGTKEGYFGGPVGPGNPPRSGMFVKGHTRGGRRPGRTIGALIREAAEIDDERLKKEAVSTLIQLMLGGDIQALKEFFNRGWGRVPLAVEVDEGGEDGMDAVERLRLKIERLKGRLPERSPDDG